MDCKAIDVVDQAHFLCIIVELPLDKSIQRGAPMLIPKGVKVRIAFHYKLLVELCFNCGMLSHKAKDYLNLVSTEAGEKRYGDWLRAGSRRLDKLRGKKFRSQISSRDEIGDQAKEPTQTPR